MGSLVKQLEYRLEEGVCGGPQAIPQRKRQDVFDQSVQHGEPVQRARPGHLSTG